MKLSLKPILCGLLMSAFFSADFVVKEGIAEIPTAMERVKQSISELKTYVTENTGKVPAAQLEQELEDRVKPIFDFREMAKRSLGASWGKLTEPQQKEFVELFSSLLSNSYLTKIRDGMQRGEFVFGDEKRKDALAIVSTKVLLDGEKIAIDYRLFLQHEQWRVYDVVIENVGLVGNYREEFAGLMRKGGFEALMENLRAKAAKQKSAEHVQSFIAHPSSKSQLALIE